jgi:predicted metal-dependent phosphoesterase TrpH
MKIDLHIHTTASDGEFSPEEIVSLAKKQGFKLIAITDHDSIGGVEEAVKVGKKLGVKVIPGVELSTLLEGKISVHMLGYGIDIKNKALNQALEKFNKERIRKAKEITEKLRKLGFKVYFSDVAKKVHGAIGKPHITKKVFAIKENQARLKREKLDLDGFLKKYLNYGGLAYVKKNKIESPAAIDLIHQAGGKAVWAHPAYSTPDKKELTRITKKFKKAGLDGIEVFYRDHKRKQVELLYGLAQKFNLFVTAGSDFHSPKRDKLGGFSTFDYLFPAPEFL